MDKQFLIVFKNVTHTQSFPFWQPTHLVAVWRNPLDALISAYSKQLYCGVRCTEPAKLADFQDWKQFAMDHAKILLHHYNTTSNLFKVHFEDMVSKEDPISAVLDYVKPDDCGSTKSMIRCVTRQDDTSSMRANKVSRNVVFGDWRKEICQVFADVWIKKWGDC